MCACDSLNENGPQRLLSLNTWPPVGGTVWEGLGHVALLEEVCQWGQALRFQNIGVIPCGLSLPCGCGSRCELSAIPLFHHHGA